MAGRRAITEAIVYDDDDEPIDLNNLNDEDLQALALANGYVMDDDCDTEDDME